MKKLLFILLLLPVVAQAAAPTIDSAIVDTRYVSPWSAPIVFRTDSLAWVRAYWGTDTTGGAYANVSDSIQALNGRFHGVVWCQDLTPGATYYYKLIVWRNGEHNDSAYSTAGTFDASSSADTLSIPGGDVADRYLMNDADRFYGLYANRASDQSGILVRGADNMKLDLRGNTIEFGDMDSIHVPNWSFESAGDWTYSDSTKTSRIVGRYYQDGNYARPTVYDGSYCIAIAPSADDSVWIESEADVTIPDGDSAMYLVSAMVSMHPIGDTVLNDMFIRLEITGCDSCYADNSKYGMGAPTAVIRDWSFSGYKAGERGMSHLYFLVSPTLINGGTDITGKIRITVAGALALTDSVFIDAVAIEPARYYGVYSEFSWARSDKDWYYPPAGGSGGGDHLTIMNGTIRCARNRPFMGWTMPIFTHTEVDGGSTNWNIFGVKCVTYGADASVISREQCETDTVMFCEVIDSGIVVRKRDGGGLRANYIAGYTDGDFYVAFNKFNGIRQNGINISPQSGSHEFNKIEWNYINGCIYHSNGFGMMLVGDTCTIRYNTIIGNSVGDTARGMGGMQIGKAANQIYGNYIYVGGGRFWEYGSEWVHGIQGEYSTFVGNYIYDNDIIVVDRYTTGDNDGAASGIKPTDIGDGNYFYNNRVDARDSSAGSAYAFFWGSKSSGIKQQHCYDNYMKADDNCYRIDHDHTLINYGPSIARDSLVKGDNADADSYFETFYLDWAESVSCTNVVALSGADVDDVTITGAGWYKPWWTLTVNAKNEGGTGIDGIYIAVANNLGDTVASGTTAGGGVFTCNLNEYRNDYSADYDSTYTPFDIHADSAATTLIDSVNSAVIGVRSIDMVFGGTSASRKVRVRR